MFNECLHYELRKLSTHFSSDLCNEFPLSRNKNESVSTCTPSALTCLWPAAVLFYCLVLLPVLTMQRHGCLKALVVLGNVSK